MRYRGPLLLMLSSILFGAMAFEAKRASARLPGAEVACFRFGVGLALIALALASGRIRLRFDRFDLLIARGVLVGLAVLCYFTTISHVDVSVATLLNFTSPVFTAFLAAWFLGEPVHPRLGFALALALGGAVV